MVMIARRVLVVETEKTRVGVVSMGLLTGRGLARELARGDAVRGNSRSCRSGGEQVFERIGGGAPKTAGQPPQ